MAFKSNFKYFLKIEMCFTILSVSLNTDSMLQHLLDGH